MKKPQYFKVYLFGSFQVLLNDAPLTAFHSVKSRALLAYLLVEANRPHARDSLATLLWGNQSTQQARTNLRTTFAKLRQLLAPLEAEPPLFTITRQTIQLNLNPARHWVDVAEFNHLLTDCEGEAVDIPACAEAMTRAVNLYQGEFLSDLGIDQVEVFELWRLGLQEEYHLRVLSLLNCLAGHHLQDSYHQLDYQRAEQYARQQLKLESWSEMAHYQLIEVLAKTSRHAAALAQFESCRRILAEELHAEPSPETMALVERIRRGEFSKGAGEQESGEAKSLSSPLPPRHPAPPLNWSEAPVTGDFFGRATELAQLRQWLVEDRCRLVTILGMGGLGKTSLAVQAAHAVSDKFEAVIWRSLLNAPTLDELLPEVLHTLSGSPVADDHLDRPAEKLSLLLDHLRQKRCLLVLDNLETIMQSDLTGQYRPGYEDYGQLIEAVAQYQHQSCLLLTSREQPLSRLLLQPNLPGVRVLPLAGLDLTAGHQILQAHGVTVGDAQAGRLTDRYSGNPLALNLLAQTIRDFYFGDVAAFLGEETPIFDDIRVVLNQQFNRLSPLEQDILLWLAVTREPLFTPDLADALIRPARQRELLETLRSLERRSLLERSEAGFLLQNVVTEYLTDTLIEQIGNEIEHGEINRLNSHPLLQAQAKTYVRHTQSRLILQPIAEQLVARLGLTGVDRSCRQLLDRLRRSPRQPGYAAGNILNLLLHLHIDVGGYDFSGLSVWQADLQGQLLPYINLAGADLSRSVFTDVFGYIYTVAFSPDGQLLAAGAVDGRIRLWSMATQQPIGMLKGHTEAVWGIAFSPDGQTLASGGVEGVIFLWDVSRGEIVGQLKGHQAGIHSVAFSPNGRTLVSGSSDQTIRLWDVGQGQITQIFTGHTNNVQAVAFSPDGEMLASGSRDNTVRLWNLTSGANFKTLRGHHNWVYAVAFSPDGQTLASASEDGTIYLWDIAVITRVQEQDPAPHHTLAGHAAGVQAVAFSPNGHTLASGSNDQTVRLWSVGGGQPLQILQGHSNWVRAVAFAPDGQTLASGAWDHTVRLWDVHHPDRYPLRTFQGYSNTVPAVAISPNGKMLASAHTDNMVRLWDMETGQLRNTLKGHQNWVWMVAFSPNGKTLASGSHDRAVRLWEAQTGQLTGVLHGQQSGVQGVAFSPNGETLASGGLDYAICLWDTQSGEIRQILKGHSNVVNSVAFSPDGKTLASGSNDKTVILWDTAAGKIRQVLEGHAGGIQNIAFSPDGNLLATPSLDTTIRLWDVASGRQVDILRGHTAWAQSVAFSPDGETLASTGYDQTVRLWDAKTGQQRQILTGHTRRVFYVTFSPNGQTLASSSSDETIKLWNPCTGACLRTLRAPGPYQGTNIAGVTGITEAQRSVLKALGAVENVETK